LLVQFVEAGNRADFHAIRELAALTFISDDVSHKKPLNEF